MHRWGEVGWKSGVVMDPKSNPPTRDSVGPPPQMLAALPKSPLLPVCPHLHEPPLSTLKCICTKAAEVFSDGAGLSLYCSCRAGRANGGWPSAGVTEHVEGLAPLQNASHHSPGSTGGTDPDPHALGWWVVLDLSCSGSKQGRSGQA